MFLQSLSAFCYSFVLTTRASIRRFGQEYKNHRKNEAEHNLHACFVKMLSAKFD